MQMNWNSLVIVICIIVAAFAVWLEAKRVNKSLLGLRITAVIIAVISLACLALPITFMAGKTKPINNEAILITKGFNTDSVKRYYTDTIVTFDDDLKRAVPNAILLHTINDLDIPHTFSHLRILGDGLDEDDLIKLNHIPIVFNPEILKEGITSIGWKDKIKAGDELKIQGTLKTSSKTRLVLKGLGTSLDSAIVDPDKTNRFYLSTVPKISGRYVYSLLTIKGKDTIERESLPVQIGPAKPLKVLVLTQAPDFEFRFLKNWLSAKGYAVAVRSAISKGKFNTEFINLEQFSLNHLTPSVLKGFDILIGDLAVLKSLKGEDAINLKREVTEMGLGVIIRPDSTLSSGSWLQRNFPLDNISIKDAGLVSLNMNGFSGKSAKLNGGISYILSKTGTQPLINDEKGRVLASSVLVGNGKIIFTTLDNTYNWMLAGNKTGYANLWSLLIGKAARKTPDQESWNVLTAVPTVLNPVQIQLQSAVKFPSVQINGKVSPLVQNSLAPFEWTTNYWPNTFGWQSIKQGNNTGDWWYVYKNEEWKTIKIFKRQADTKAYAKEHGIKTSVTKQIQKNARISVPKIYFYTLLLFACVFLWMETKFYKKTV